MSKPHSVLSITANGVVSGHFKHHQLTSDVLPTEHNFRVLGSV